MQKQHLINAITDYVKSQMLGTIKFSGKVVDVRIEIKQHFEEGPFEFTFDTITILLETEKNNVRKWHRCYLFDEIGTFSTIRH